MKLHTNNYASATIIFLIVLTLFTSIVYFLAIRVNYVNSLNHEYRTTSVTKQLEIASIKYIKENPNTNFTHCIAEVCLNIQYIDEIYFVKITTETLHKDIEIENVDGVFNINYLE